MKLFYQGFWHGIVSFELKFPIIKHKIGNVSFHINFDTNTAPPQGSFPYSLMQMIYKTSF